MKRTLYKRSISLMLSFALLAGYVPATVFAEDLSGQGLCQHHTEHIDCAYAPAVEATDCGHQHDDSCYAAEEVCVHIHEDCGTEEVPCEHICDEAAGCIVRLLNCQHIHESTCGYAEAKDAQACDFVCEACIGGEEEMEETSCDETLECIADDHTDACLKKAADEQAAREAAEKTAAEEKLLQDQVAADTVEAMIDALSSLDDIRTKSLEDQEADYIQVQNAYDAYEQLTEDQKALLPPAEAVFKPYFDYFNNQIQTADGGSCGTFATWEIAPGTSKLVISGSGLISSKPWASGDGPGGYAPYITSIEVKSGITSIGSGIFRECINATKVSLPEGLTSIGTSAFAGCAGLEGVILPDDVELDGSTFKDCTSLGYVETDITGLIFSKYARGDFAGCTSLKYVYISPEVTAIPADTFKGCISLRHSMLNNSITDIGASAYEGCSGLESIYFYENLRNIDSRAFANCTGIKKLMFMDNAPQIADNAFQGVTAVAYYPANDPTWTEEKCQNYGGNITWLTHVDGHIHDFNRQYFEGHCTCGARAGECGINYSDNAKWILETTGELTIYGSGEVEGYETVNYMEHYAPWGPYYNEKLPVKTVVIEPGITNIGYGAFDGCSELTSISIPSSVTSIGDYAFRDCSSLTEITIPDGVSEMSLSMFEGCSSLTEITIPAGVSEISTSMFSGCSSLSSVNIPDGVTRISTSAFSGCESLTSITIPDSVSVIYGGAFSGCTGLTDVTIPEGVTVIENHVFSGCVNLTGITLPNSLKYLGSSVFYNCDNLTDIVIPDSVTTLGGYAFGFCDKLTNVTIGKSVPAINSETFYGCKSLVSITIPASVKEFRTWDIFGGCTSLKEMIFLGDAPEIDVYALRNITVTAYYPAGNKTWEDAITLNYRADITWVPYTVEKVKLPKPVVAAAGNAQTGGGILTWEAAAEADSYEIYRATSSKGKYSKVETVSGGEARVNVPVGKTYYYKVKAVCEEDASLNSSYSDVVKVTGKCAQVTLTVTASTSSGKPVAKWGKISGAEKYAVYRADSADGSYTKVKTTTSRSYTDTSAVAGATYYYKVRALASKSTYNGAYSEIVSCLTICARPSVTVKIESSGGKPALSWGAVKGAVGYRVLRAESSDGEFIQLADLQTERSYSDANAAPDKDYWYQVVAVGNEEAMNNTVTVKVHTTLAKPVVTFRTDSVSGKPSLTWKTVEGAVEYKVYRSSYSTKSYKAVKTIKETGEAEYTYTDTSVSVSKGYYYKVIAIGAGSKSAYSSYKKLTAKCAQAVPNAAASTSSGKPVVKWGKISGAAKYEVYRADSADGSYAKIKTTTSRSYTDTKAAVGTTYYYKVRALASKSTYNGAYSEVVSCLTVCAQPVLSLKTEAVTGKPVLSWNNISGASGYEICRSVDGAAEEIIVVHGTVYTETDAKTDSKYSYKVKAIAEDPELNSAESKVHTIAATCGKPTASIKLNGKKPMVSWEPVDHAAKYAVYRSTKSSSGFKKIATVTAESYTDKKATKGTTYYYKIVAVTEGGNTSAYSNRVKLRSK